MPHPLIKGTSFFTDAEQDWIRANMDEFLELNGKARVQVPGHTRTETVASSHYDVLQKRFKQRFPYRDPKCKESYEEKYEGLECTEKEWIGMGRRIYVWLQKRKNMELKVASKVGLNSGLNQLTSLKKQQSSSRSKRNTTQSVLREDLKILGPEYRSNPLKTEVIASMISEIAGDAKASWAEVTEEESERRQSNLPADLQTVIDILSRSTGAEIYATAVWQREGEVKSVDISSERLQGYLETDEAMESCQSFQEHVFTAVGPSLETSHMHAGRAIFANPARGGMPVLPPPLADLPDTEIAHETRLAAAKLDLTWGWQGGQLPIPWSHLERDSREGRYHLIEKSRLPEGVDYLRKLCEERSVNTRFYYPPESIAYALRVAQPALSTPSNREDGLPLFDPHDAYTPIDLDSIQATAAILTNSPLHEPYLFLGEYERAGPFQLQKPLDTDWHTRCSGFPHLPAGLPPDDASLEFFCAHRSSVREEFFNFLDRDHARWSLPACLAWANPENWIHPLSGTIVGGPYGCKWPILLLAFLLVSAQQLELGQDPEYPKLWADRFGDSVGTLLAASDRRVAKADLQELLSGQRADLVIKREEKESQSYEDFVASQEATEQSVLAGKKRVASGSSSRRKRAKSGNSDDARDDGNQESDGGEAGVEDVAASGDEVSEQGPAPAPLRRGKSRGRIATRVSQRPRGKRTPKVATGRKPSARLSPKAGKAGPATKASSSKQKSGGKAAIEPDVDVDVEAPESEPEEQDELESDDDASPATDPVITLLFKSSSFKNEHHAVAYIWLQRVYPVLCPPSQQDWDTLAMFKELIYTNHTGIEPNGHGWQAHVTKIASVILKRLAVATGANFFVVGCWGEDERSTLCMSYATDAVKQYSSTDNGVATLDNFSIYAERLLGPGFTTLPSKVMALTKVGSDWQGSTEPIDWKAVADDMEAGGETYIERKRLPVGCPSLRNCELWTLAETRLLAHHIRSHQARLDEGDRTAEQTAFQWKRLVNRQAQAPIVELSYRNSIHEPILYGYSAGSASYMNRVMREAADPLPVKHLCSETERMMLEDSHLLHGELPMLLEMVEYTCSKGRFEVSKRLCKTGEMITVLTEWVARNKTSLSMALSHVELPPPFYYLNSQTFWKWSPQEMMRWSCSRRLGEASEGLIKGSPLELFAHFLAIVIIARQVSHPITPHAYAEGIRYEFGNNDRAFIALAAAGLKENIRRAFPQAGNHSSFITCRPSRYKPLRLNQAYKQILDSQSRIVMRRAEWVPTGGMLDFWPAHLSTSHGLQEVEHGPNQMDWPDRYMALVREALGAEAGKADANASATVDEHEKMSIKESNTNEPGSGRRAALSRAAVHLDQSLQTTVAENASAAGNANEDSQSSGATRRYTGPARDRSGRVSSASAGSSIMRMEVVIPVRQQTSKPSSGTVSNRPRSGLRSDPSESDAPLQG
ncbi:hypothetical protein BDV93DRAFT_515982 [Ceratobasidium sp. AG-I]|nr:hypothetical protein BDV93DRAFT_515982 [Ceratobasidium sp. AG-I]